MKPGCAVLEVAVTSFFLFFFYQYVPSPSASLLQELAIFEIEFIAYINFDSKL